MKHNPTNWPCAVTLEQADFIKLIELNDNDAVFCEYRLVVGASIVGRFEEATQARAAYKWWLAGCPA